MKSKLRESGYLMVDNRHSGGSLSETATKTCAHCQATVVMNPLRQRERHWCTRCDAYICDGCTAFECVPFKKILDDAVDASAKGRGLILPDRFNT